MKKLTAEQLNTLYDIWKEVEGWKERLALIEERLPKVQALNALSVMRKMAKTDTKWLKMTTRKKNQEEKEKQDKEKAKAQKIAERETKKKEREEKREVSEQKKKSKKCFMEIYANFNKSHLDKLKEMVKPEFFFCPDIQQFVNNLSCIYRVFSHEYVDLTTGPCEKCKRLNEYIPILEEIVNGRQKRPKNNKTNKGSKNKEKGAKGDS